jgi:hypothetical protein
MNKRLSDGWATESLRQAFGQVSLFSVIEDAQEWQSNL